MEEAEGPSGHDQSLMLADRKGNIYISQEHQDGIWNVQVPKKWTPPHFQLWMGRQLFVQKSQNVFVSPGGSNEPSSDVQAAAFMTQPG